MSGPRWPRVAAAGLGFVWFLQIAGLHPLNPTDFTWIYAGDWMQHLFGWLLFRGEPWTFPLGALRAVPYPVGSNIGFTDSNPLVSLLLKPFSGLLPAEFQFIGPWIALCFVLQGYVGAALTSVVTKEPEQQVLGGYLFVLSPVLLSRLAHDTLCAHWLLLGLLYLGLREHADPGEARRSALLAGAAAVLAASIHPYLAAMCGTLALAVDARLWRTGHLSPVRAAVSGLATTLGMLCVFGVIGYFGRATIGATGLGDFSSDLLTLVNPGQYSRLLPALPARPVQMNEGIGYLGLGGLLASLVALVVLVRRRPRPGRRVGVVVAACALMAVYALSPSVSFEGREVLSLRWLYGLMGPLVGAFRASGRFIWPFHYLVLIFGVWGLTRAVAPDRRTLGTMLVALAVAVQAADLTFDGWWFTTKTFRQAPVAAFDRAVGHYRHLALVPMQVLGACGGPWEQDDVYRYMLHAYRLHTTYNSGVFARLPASRVRAECGRLERSIAEGVLDPQTIYVVAPDRVPRFREIGAACGRFDGDWICVDRQSDAGFRNLVETGK
jgi:hypothetical protein